MSQIIRGNDELAFYLKGVGAEYHKDIYTAVMIKENTCPLCNKMFYNSYDNALAFKEIYEHLNFRCQQKYQVELFNKTYAMLQQLIKYQVNDGNRIRAKINKKAEVVYSLNKVHGLPIHLIAKLLDISLNRAMELSYRGLILCNDKLPNWINNVLEHKE